MYLSFECPYILTFICLSLYMSSYQKISRLMYDKRFVAYTIMHNEHYQSAKLMSATYIVLNAIALNILSLSTLFKQ